MTKGALYFHFPSKDGLADAVQERGRALLCDFVQDRRERGVASMQALIDLTHWLARTLHKDPVVRASLRIPHECVGRRPPVDDFQQAWITEVVRLLGQARAAGELRDDPSGEGAEALLSATVCGIGVLTGTGISYAEPGRKVGVLWEQLLAALVPPGDAGRYRTYVSDAGSDASDGLHTGAGADAA